MENLGELHALLVRGCQAVTEARLSTKGTIMHTTRYWLPSSVLLLSLAACGAQKYEVRGTELAPAADARIKAKLNAQTNVMQVDIKATDLTPPDRLLPEGNAYVIWTRPERSAVWSRAGALALQDDGRRGDAELTVPARSFDLAITAEADTNVVSPSGKTVIERHVEDD